MAETSLPSSWSEAVQSLHANSLWFFPLVAAERVFDGHPYQALGAMAVWVIAAIAAVQRGVVQKVTSTPERRRQLLTWGLIAIGAAALIWGIARLATEPQLANAADIAAAATKFEERIFSERGANRELIERLEASTRQLEDLKKKDETAQRALAVARGELQEAINQRDAVRTQQIPPQPTPSNPQSAVIKGPVAWDFNRQFVVVSGGETNAQVHSILLQGKSTDSTSFKEAYAISALTGRKQELVANANGYHPVTSVDVPAQAPVWLELLFDPVLSLRDFQDKWGRLRVVIVYGDGTIFQHDFDEAYVREKLTGQVPSAFGPRVTPRDKK
jgi:hypothetical protein